ncbi:Sec14p-like phosphatidylinositol transfer family protein [Euphorbia peplus]|nr:Sec14p-like phosphatidylinositol transfer family protein [Euphorbia peplus]
MKSSSCADQAISDNIKEEKLSKCNEMETTKLSSFRASLDTQEPSSKGVDDGTLRRFLRARDLDIDKASTMLIKYLKWRKEFVPNGSISPSQVSNEIAQNKMFLQGFDKKGRPIAILLAGRHFQNKSLDEFKRFVVCVLDKISTSIPEGEEKFAVIADLQGWGYANCDIRGYLSALSILQDYYPERLGKCFIVHVPYIFMAAWKIIYPFIDNNTKKKIVFVENPKLKSALLEDIDESQIPTTYGGHMPLVPIVEL